VGGLKGCEGLTELGREQVALLGDYLLATGDAASIDALYSSLLPRAIETGAILKDVCGFSQTMTPDCAFCELHPGEADGLSWAEYADRFDEPTWDENPSIPIAPGGESWETFQDRVEIALKRVASTHQHKSILIATHAGVISAAIARLLPVDKSLNRLTLSPDHASLASFVLIPTAHEPGRFMLERYNVTGYPKKAVLDT
jgi:probable phosphoglycerate mutase